ncbi:MAG: hypothetical protein AB8E15_08450 [Bdellovibrionales bacterium]
MKLFMIVSSLFFSLNALASCPDLTGTYKGTYVSGQGVTEEIWRFEQKVENSTTVYTSYTDGVFDISFAADGRTVDGYPTVTCKKDVLILDHPNSDDHNVKFQDQLTATSEYLQIVTKTFIPLVDGGIEVRYNLVRFPRIK